MGLKEEQAQKAKYLLETEDFEGMRIVKLTTDNVARVEAMILYDPDYAKAGDKNACPTYKKNGEEDYFGSTAYWMTQLKGAIERGEPSQLRSIVHRAVVAVDKENKTHINSDHVGREQLTDRILAKATSLKEILSDVESGVKFIEEIAAITTDVDLNHKARTNLSFASKFAHYACFYLFEEDDPRRDNFSIYDRVVNEALPIYIKKYHLADYDPNSYLSYYRCIEEIIRRSGESLSRNGFDHLLWYYYRVKRNAKKIPHKRPAPSKKERDASALPAFNTQLARDYIMAKKEEAKRLGQSEITIVALEIARHFKRWDRCAPICSAMRQSMREGDVILSSPPKGTGTKLEIKYRLD